MRRPYIHLAGELSGWPHGFVPQPGHFRKLDQFSSELVNGEEGGTWAPKSPIVIGTHGGQDTVLLTTAGSQITGNIRTEKGNAEQGGGMQTGLVMTSGLGPAFATPRSRLIHVPFTNFSETNSFGLNGSAAWNYAFVFDPTTFALRANYVWRPGGGGGGGATPPLVVVTVPLPIRAQHRAATISSLTFRYRIVRNPISLGAARKTRIRLVKVVADTVLPLHTNAGGYDADGWLIDPAANAAAYYANGKVKVLTYVPDQNHTNVDPSTGFYALQFMNDDIDNIPKGGTGNEFYSAQVSITNIADMRQE